VCDCYDAECSYPGCSILMPVHIADFCMERDEIEVFCWNHLPEPGPNVIVYRADQNIGEYDWWDRDWDDTYDPDHCTPTTRDQWAMGVRYLVDPPGGDLECVCANAAFATIPVGSG